MTISNKSPVDRLENVNFDFNVIYSDLILHGKVTTLCNDVILIGYVTRLHQTRTFMEQRETKLGYDVYEYIHYLMTVDSFSY